jgi:sugar PTS system EIIA component
MLGKLFGKKAKAEFEEVYSPLEGEVVSLNQVPDPVFAQKMMGDGIALIPSSGQLVSPVEGKIVQVIHTKHAVGLKSVNGLEILIHVGLETVELKGEGFEVLVQEGQSVKVGDPLLNFDIPFLQSQNKEIITPIVVTNTDEKLDYIAQKANGAVKRGELLFTAHLK